MPGTGVTTPTIPEVPSAAVVPDIHTGASLHDSAGAAILKFLNEPTYVDLSRLQWGGFQAAGGDYLVDKPTMFIAGDQGLERATFSGAGRTTHQGEDLAAEVKALRADMARDRERADIDRAMLPHLAGVMARDLAQLGRRR